MKAEKVAAIGSVALCSFAILSSLLIIPSLYGQISRLSDEVVQEVNAFKVSLPASFAGRWE